jgi:dienelactone hydrolase
MLPALILATFLHFHSSGDRIDQEVSIHVEGLASHAIPTLRATAQDGKGENWVSWAVFKADEEGCIDVAKQAPIKGSYEGIDSMGLFWSMVPASENPAALYTCKNDEFKVTFELGLDEKVVERQSITRYLKNPDIQRIAVKERGLQGALFIPQSDQPLPLIITLTGSNGGLSENKSKLLASRGFAVFALGYFAVDGLPSDLREIPLEYFETAFEWLKSQPMLDASRVGIYGASRGGELALILGSIFPNAAKAIVAVVPSSVVYSDLEKTPRHAWLYRNQPVVPFASLSLLDLTEGKGTHFSNPASWLKSYLDGMKESKVYEAASIPVEKIRCPILLISGGDDQLWPSAIYSQQIVKRLQNFNSPIECLHLNYPQAGHWINIPNFPQPNRAYYHPVFQQWYALGGTASADQHSSVDSWEKMISFFHEKLD